MMNYSNKVRFMVDTIYNKKTRIQSPEKALK